MISIESVNCPNTVYYQNILSLFPGPKEFFNKKRKSVPKFIHLEC